MSIETAKTPVKKLETTSENCSRGKYVLVEDWADYHGIYQWLVPLEYRQWNVIEVLRQLSETMADLPATTHTITRNQLGFKYLPQQLLRHIFPLFGLIKFRHTTQPRYINPEYLHWSETLQPIREMDKRKEFYESHRHIPTLSRQFYADVFGVSKCRFGNIVRGWSDVPDRTEQRRKNQERIGRSLWTTYAWGVATQAKLCEIIPADNHQVQAWIRRHGRESDWKPPQRPCDKGWFNHS